MSIEKLYAVACSSVVALAFAGFGYLMLFKPSAYVDLRNWHFQKSGLMERLTIERCSRFDHRASGFGLLLFGVFMLYFSIRSLLH